MPGARRAVVGRSPGEREAAVLALPFAAAVVGTNPAEAGHLGGGFCNGSDPNKRRLAMLSTSGVSK